MKRFGLGWLRWVLMLILLLVGLLPSFNAVKAQDVNSVVLIDLQTDSNNDGLPDELVAEVLKIRNTAEGVSAASAEEQASILQQAMANLVAHLPYSTQTQNALARLNDLQNELLITEDLTQRMNLVNELETLDAQMMADPAYVTTIHTLDVLINEQKIDAPRYRFSLYLPTIAVASSTANANVANAASEAESEAQSKLQKMQLSANVSASAVNAGPAWDWIYAGDTLFIRGSWWDSLANRILYCMNFCHAGTYNGNQLVLESNPWSPKSGVRLLTIADWKKRGAYVGLAFTRTTTYAQDRAALEWAKTKWKTNGTTKYNFNIINKGTDSELYCSQLVWKQLRYNGKEVDSNNWAYLMWVYARWGLIGYNIAVLGVMPDEVALDNDMAIWSAGTNP